MATAYTIRSGDNLSKLAKQFGLPSWREIYFAPENVTFRMKRPNPDLIYPGDVVMIPARNSAVPAGLKLCGRKEVALDMHLVPDVLRRVR